MTNTTDYDDETRQHIETRRHMMIITNEEAMKALKGGVESLIARMGLTWK